MGALVRRWNLMEELAQRLQQLETQVGQQRAVIEHQQEQLMRQQTMIDAERAARTPINPAQDARGNLVDLRAGNKPETFAGETHEWKGSSFKMRQHTAAVEETQLGTRECGSESVARDALGWHERASEKTSKTACVHANSR